MKRSPKCIDLCSLGSDIADSKRSRSSDGFTTSTPSSSFDSVSTLNSIDSEVDMMAGKFETMNHIQDTFNSPGLDISQFDSWQKESFHRKISVSAGAVRESNN